MVKVKGMGKCLLREARRGCAWGGEGGAKGGWCVSSCSFSQECVCVNVMGNIFE